MIGILGGMGPLATVDFMQKVIEATPAKSDQEHVPLLVHSVPTIPDRTRAILSGGESPLPHLLQGLDTLVAGGAQCVAVPCNTAHYWHAALAQHSPVPVLHIADSVSDALRATGVDCVGLLATRGTIAAGFYQQRLAVHGYHCLLPEAAELDALVMAGIYAVKSGNISEGGRLLEQAALNLRGRGAGAVILACTEIPPALAHIGSPAQEFAVDATRVLAAACVAWWLSSRAPELAQTVPASVLS